MFSCYISILWYKKGTLAHNEIRVQKLDNQYPKKCKYEVVLKFSKILNQV